METEKQDHIRVAYYYYKLKLTQEQIAEKMKMSRQKVNRILGSCEETGIITISVNGTADMYLEIESKLESLYGLKAVRIVEGGDETYLNSRLGESSAAYLSGVMTPDDIIGFSRGMATSALVEAITCAGMSGITVTQLVGGSNSSSHDIESDDLVTRFAGKLNASAVKLYAPVIVKSPDIRNSIMEEPYFMEAYETVRRCTIAVAGIGTVAKRINEQALKNNNASDFTAYRESGAVGEICAHFFDCEGNPVTTETDGRLITIGLDDLLGIPLRIGVAGGFRKASAVRGALEGGYINVLVTDSDTAAEIIKQGR